MFEEFCMVQGLSRRFLCKNLSTGVIERKYQGDHWRRCAKIKQKNACQRNRNLWGLHTERFTAGRTVHKPLSLEKVYKFVFFQKAKQRLLCMWFCNRYIFHGPNNRVKSFPVAYSINVVSPIKLRFVLQVNFDYPFDYPCTGGPPACDCPVRVPTCCSAAWTRARWLCRRRASCCWTVAARPPRWGSRESSFCRFRRAFLPGSASATVCRLIHRSELL